MTTPQERAAELRGEIERLQARTVRSNDLPTIRMIEEHIRILRLRLARVEREVRDGT